MDDSGRQDRDAATHPFVAFRRFADEQMASAVNGIFGIFQQSPIRRQQMIKEYEQWLKQERAKAARQEQNDAHRTANIFSQAFREQVDVAGQNSGQQDDSHEGGYSSSACPFVMARRAATLANPTELRERYDSLFFGCDSDSIFKGSWLLQDPYSPLVLEQILTGPDQSPSWRAAFEDLLYAHTGHDLPQRDCQVKSELEDGNRWASNMRYEFNKTSEKTVLAELAQAEAARIQAGFGQMESTPPTQSSPDDHSTNDRPEVDPVKADFIGRMLSACSELPTSESRKWCLQDLSQRAVKNVLGLDQGASKCPAGGISALLEAEDEEDDEAEKRDGTDEMTELDFYQFVNGTASHSFASTSASIEQNSSPKSTTDGPSKPSLLSTLTTTESRTLPDGTKTAKIVLKKRFSDGVEESNERHYTEHVRPPSVPPKSITEQIDMKKDRTESSDKSKKGWFWT